MIQQQKREAIEKKVRDVCPELNGGHEYNYSPRCVHCNEERYVRDRQVLNRIVDEGTGGSIENVTETIYDNSLFPCSKNAYKEIHLEHLLRTIDECRAGVYYEIGTGGHIMDTDGIELAKYDLTLSFSQNLKNDKLTDFLYQLFCE